MTNTRFQQKRGTTAEWLAKTTPLLDGEIGIDKDTGEIKIGDGATMWVDLPSILGSSYLPVLGTAHDSYRLGGQEPEFYMPASAGSGFLKTADAASFLPANGQAVDSAKLGGNAPSFYLPASAAGSFLPLLGKAADADLLDGHDSTYFATAADGLTHGKYWGSGTAFPTDASLKPGDTFLRTDQGVNGSLWTYSGAGRGAGGWTHRGPVTTDSVHRPTVTYPGLELLETDTYRYYIFSGQVSTTGLLGPWVYISGGKAPIYKLQLISGTPGWYGWNDTRGGGYENPYATVISGEVHIRGLLGNTNAVSNYSGSFASLPPEIAPSSIALRPAFVTSGSARIDVFPATDPTYPAKLNVTQATMPATSWWSFDFSYPLYNTTPLLLP